MIQKQKYCARCKNDGLARLVRNITASGTSQVYWLHLACKKSIDTPTKFIKHELIIGSGFEIDNLPVIENYSGTNLCAVCSSPFAEYHHWAPKHLFGAEAELWPGAYLCDKCHKRWHALVTPSMALKRGVMHDEHLQTIGK